MGQIGRGSPRELGAEDGGRASELAGSLDGVLERLFHRAPDGIVVTRLRDGQIVLANDAFGRMLGYSTAQIVGRGADEFGLWPEPEMRSDLMADLLGGVRRETLEARLRTSDGGARDIEMSAELIEIDSEPHAFGITRDITERKDAERALRASEDRFRTLVHSSRDAILVTDAEGNLGYCSPGVEFILGYQPEELVGSHERDLIHPDDLVIRDALVARLKSDPTPHPPAQLRMRHRDGTWRWVETIDTNRLDDPAVSGIVTNARDITDRKQTEETTVFRALHDPLTGLPNRRLLDDRIEIAIDSVRRTSKSVAVLFCDLDGFKEINDSMGHEAGDELLRRIAQRLRSIVRPSDSLARLGGDEFVVVGGDLDSVEGAARLADRIASTVRAPLELEAGEVQVTASIGIAIVTGPKPDPVEAGALLRNADAAMYRAKDRGRDRWEIFDAGMEERVRVRFELADQLQEALEARRFEVFYQPIVHLADGAIVGAEALLRWRHPTRGLLAPADFLDIAESSGLIVPIGEWVMNEVIEQLDIWHSKDHPTIWASVNVSGRQLGDRGIRELLSRQLAGADSKADSLRLELTESVLIEHSAAVEGELMDAVALGVRVGIDDFGTGYSSLAYLQHFPLTFLKIDGSFVHDLDSHPGPPSRPSRPVLVAAILQLSRTLEIEAIAEGIETAGQAAALARLGCNLGQGYLFGAPVPADAMTQLLSAPLAQRDPDAKRFN